MEKIDQSDYDRSVARLTGLLTDITAHAQEQSKTRCPYKNRFDQCTAKFGCRNKRKPRAEDQLPACAGDDKLDYRSAWETDPDLYVQVRDTIRKNASGPCKYSDQAMAQIWHDQQSRPAQAGKTIFDYADDLRLRVPTSCGRSGHCHECVVEIKRGMEALCPPSETEKFLRGDYRLACQACVERPDVDVEFVLLRRTPQILTAQDRSEVELDPAVTRRGDHVYYLDDQIDTYRGHLYGLAIDVGTTTVVAEMVDLETGRSAYLSSFENPQRFGGSDVMHRISYDGGEFQGELHQALINTLNGEIRRMCDKLNIGRHEIYEFVVAGNSTMREIFFNHDVQSIGQKPYKSQIEEQYLAGERDTTSLTEPARSLRLWANRRAQVFAAPIIASHVGGDVAADLLAMDMAGQNEVVMLVDVGTNSEVVVGHKDRLIAASCPAGPAFEGGLISFGMPGCDGAIESVRYDDGKFICQTIGQTEPRGICGSGLIDLLAELRRHDLMTPKGVFADKADQFDIVPEQGITFSRNDASELAQAKAANYCGQIILMRQFGITPDQVTKLYLSGGFANYVDPANAVEIGFLAPVPAERIAKIGNAAAQGARQMLLSKRARRSIEELVKTIEHVELETTADFFDVFVEGCQFKPMQFPAQPRH